jgi:hypothetical protein
MARGTTDSPEYPPASHSKGDSQPLSGCRPLLQTEQDTMSDNTHTTEARDGKFDQSGTEGSIQTVSDEVTDDTDLYGVLDSAVAEQLGEYFTVTVSEEAEVMAEQTGETKNYGKYETPSRAAYGIGISRDILSDLTGEEVPDEIGLTFAASTEESFEEAVEELEETVAEETADEADALLADAGSDGVDAEETDDSDDEEELSEEEQEAEALLAEAEDAD